MPITFIHPDTGEEFPAYLDSTQLPRVRGRTLEQYERARALRRAQSDKYGDIDPDFVATYNQLDDGDRQAAKSKKIGPRVKAAAARERAVTRAKTLTNPSATEAQPAPGEDLASLVDRAAAEIASAVPPDVQATDFGDFDPVDWARKAGLGARLRDDDGDKQ